VIVATGIDIVEIRRIERAMKHPSFLHKILTPAERATCRTPSAVAGRWAAKEAAMKCLKERVTFRRIEVVSGPSGAPQLRFIDVEESAGLIAHVSISHERSMAVALVILERI
jgi:holo-[acyl-carrier protein] synthase